MQYGQEWPLKRSSSRGAAFLPAALLAALGLAGAARGELHLCGAPAEDDAANFPHYRQHFNGRLTLLQQAVSRAERLGQQHAEG